VTRLTSPEKVDDLYRAQPLGMRLLRLGEPRLVLTELAVRVTGAEAEAQYCGTAYLKPRMIFPCMCDADHAAPPGEEHMFRMFSRAITPTLIPFTPLRAGL